MTEKNGEVQRDILNIDEAAELLGVSVKTFNKVLHAEDMPARKIGREWKFSRRALIEWVGSGRPRDHSRAGAQGERAGNRREAARPAHRGLGDRTRLSLRCRDSLSHEQVLPMHPPTNSGSSDKLQSSP